MSQIRKRLSSILLTGVMLLSLLPTTALAAGPEEPLNILCIGNSHTVNYTTFFEAIAEDTGLSINWDRIAVSARKLYTDSTASMSHVTAATFDTDRDDDNDVDIVDWHDYVSSIVPISYTPDELNTKFPWSKEQYDAKLNGSTTWDVIIVQDHGESGYQDTETVVAGVQKAVNWLKNSGYSAVAEDTKIAWCADWPVYTTSTSGDNTATTKMNDAYEAVEDQVTGLDLLIPTGLAVQNAKTSYWNKLQNPNVVEDCSLIYCDSTHMSIELGCYLVGATVMGALADAGWVKTTSGATLTLDAFLSNLKTAPTVANETGAFTSTTWSVLKECVTGAIKNPYQKTESSYPDYDDVGMALADNLAECSPIDAQDAVDSNTYNDFDTAFRTLYSSALEQALREAAYNGTVAFSYEENAGTGHALVTYTNGEIERVVQLPDFVKNSEANEIKSGIITTGGWDSNGNALDEGGEIITDPEDSEVIGSYRIYYPAGCTDPNGAILEISGDTPSIDIGDVSTIPWQKSGVREKIQKIVVKENATIRAFMLNIYNTFSNLDTIEIENGAKLKYSSVYFITTAKDILVDFKGSASVDANTFAAHRATQQSHQITISGNASDFTNSWENYVNSASNENTAMWGQYNANGEPFGIYYKRVAVPTAADGLVWTGEELTGVANGTGYTVSGGTAIACGSHTATATLEAGFSWADYTTDAKEIVWSIAKIAGPAKPNQVIGVMPTGSDANDGKITGVDSTMEYSTTPDFSDAVGCTGTEITGLAPGTYYVRIKETDTQQAGAYATVTVPAYTEELSGIMTTGGWDDNGNPLGADGSSIVSDVNDPEVIGSYRIYAVGEEYIAEISGSTPKFDMAASSRSPWAKNAATLTKIVVKGDANLNAFALNINASYKKLTTIEIESGAKLASASIYFIATNNDILVDFKGAASISTGAFAAYNATEQTHQITLTADANVVSNWQNYVNNGASDASAMWGKNNANGEPFGIYYKRVAAPTAADDLVWTGKEQTGVANGTGYTVSGGTATACGSHTATATLEAGFSWADYTTDAKEIEWSIAHASLVKTDAKAASCIETGNSAYWTCSECGKFFSDAFGKIEIEENSWVIDKTPHTYGAPTYTWTADGKSCTAEKSCTTDGCTEKIVEIGTITSAVKTPATYTEKGTTTYTATFTGADFTTQTKDVQDIPVLVRPSSGGSSSSSNTTTSTTKNPDGSTTTTVTNKFTGVVTETTKTKDGTTVVKTTDKNDNTTVTANVPSAAINAAKGEAVTLPTTVSDGDSLKISTAKVVQVEIPVEDVTPGHVAVIVNKDGTEKIVSTSVVTENGVVLTISGTETVKVIDNAKMFTDVPKTNVFYNEISSLSAREIMVGKTETLFDLYSSVTLNQIANVAGRIIGAVDLEDFNAGIVWGIENGLKTGNVAATRGDVLKALYIAAGSPAVEDTSVLARFGDSSSIPTDLMDATAWATANGILKGDLNGNANLDANVTRGQACALAGRTLVALAAV